jgi:predicted  nucleic acid-binding Zn-ribbon protein
MMVALQEIGALRDQLAEVERLKKSEAERKKELTRLNKQVEQLSAAEAERKKELTRLNKQVEQLSAAKSELEQRGRGLEESLAKATSAHKESLSALTRDHERLQEELSRTKTTTVR